MFTQIKAALTTLAASKTSKPITMTELSSLYGGLHCIPISDFEKLAASGRLAGATRVGKNGYNTSVGTSREDIWSPGGIMIKQTSGQLIELVSSDAADDNNGGAGARQVTVQGVDQDFNAITEVISLSGTSAVASTKKFLRINLMTVTSRGTYAPSGANTGTITARTINTQQVMGEIPVDAEFGGAGQMFSSHYCVPAGKGAFIYYVFINHVSTKVMDVSAQVRSNDGNMTQAPFIGTHQHQFDYRDLPAFADLNIQKAPFFLPPKTDVWFEGVIASGGSGAGFMSINYGMIVFDI